jgi:DNA-binding transcriptional ArsR family regulator
MTTAVPSAPPGTALSVRAESGPSFELLATTQAFLFRSHHAYYDLGRAWFAKLGRSAPDTFAQLRGFAGGSVMIWDHLYGLALEAGGQHAIGSFIDRVEQMHAPELRMELLGRRYRNVLRTVGAELVEEAAAGSATAQRDFLRLAWPEDSPWQTGIRELLKDSPAHTQERLVNLLRALERDVAEQIGPTLEALAADAEEKRLAALVDDPLDVIRAAIDTAYVPSAEVQGVVLIPSFVIRPQVYYFEFADQMIFVYPLSERLAESLGAGPSDRLVRLAAALGDRGRLRILAALKERRMSLKELGDELKVPRSTLRHHMGILYLAGLVRPVQTGVSGFNAYQLREEAATDLTELVDKFLRGPV